MFEPEARAIEIAVDGSGPSLVLLPGGSLRISYLDSVAAELAAHGIRVIRIGSRRASPDVSMHDLANDVIDVLDSLDVSQAWIGGHAFGNRVARTVALDHADRVDGIVLLAAGGTVQPTGEAQQALMTVFSNPSDEQVMDAMPYLIGDASRASEAWDVVKDAIDGSLGPMQREAVQSTPHEEWAGLAAGKPVFIVQGTNDQIAPPENGQQLQDAAPAQVTLGWVEGGGHLFAAMYPKQTADLIASKILPGT